MRAILDAQGDANRRAADVRSGALARFAWSRAAAETTAVYREAL
jgi:hypothetical protein